MALKTVAVRNGLGDGHLGPPQADGLDLGLDGLLSAANAAPNNNKRKVGELPSTRAEQRGTSNR